MAAGEAQTGSVAAEGHYESSGKALDGGAAEDAQQVSAGICDAALSYVLMIKTVMCGLIILTGS